ncbi:unnamed protein product [Cylindrotheca closterium]|uniref:Bidirectional sugar transporter SWEET n=1 Tax=Cylindrotheca closterium TaxID=2856 RepID=A0AAD2FR02_9STRA|nr:unnamed protein product [Cylindrotheca closterium]
MNMEDIILEYVCPSMGCIMANAMNAAPISDLRQALTVGTLGDLNPSPWVFMTGNCLGLCAYSYYTNDPFILAANLPGLLLSLWLNHGAIKLQYLELRTRAGGGGGGDNLLNNHNNNNIGGDDEEALDLQDDSIIHGVSTSNNQRTMDEQRLIPPEAMIFVSQEVKLYRILLVWSSVLIWVGWISPLLRTINSSIFLTRISSGTAPEIVGLGVNMNLIFFYGAPLTSIFQVVKTRRSSSIHRPTMYMSFMNATFWTGYGFARMDPFIIVPNGVGMILGIVQFTLCRMFPKGEGDRIPIRGESFDDDGLMMTKVNTGHDDYNDNDSKDNQTGGDVELDDDDLEFL